MLQIKLMRALKMQAIAGIACALSQPLQAGNAHAGIFIALLRPLGAASCENPGKDNFSNVAKCMTQSVENVPGLLTALAYLMGLLLGSMAIVKMKEHVENPSQTPFKDCAVRLAAGGALFALPILYEAMINTTGNNGIGASAAKIYKARANVF